FFSSRRRHTRWPRDWSSDVCSSDLAAVHHEHLASPAAEHVNGQVFVVHGGTVALVEPPRIEQRWPLDELETSVSAFFAERDPGRSEERRVGKERRCSWMACREISTM